MELLELAVIRCRQWTGNRNIIWSRHLYFLAISPDQNVTGSVKRGLIALYLAIHRGGSRIFEGGSIALNNPHSNVR